MLLQEYVKQWYMDMGLQLHKSKQQHYKRVHDQQHLTLSKDQ